jgi:acyl-CoA synthetase (AMP-forming)/AMP-acid ligase II
VEVRSLGLHRVRGAATGAAPIAPEVIKWFMALGIDLREGYGQTENCGLATIVPRDRRHCQKSLSNGLDIDHDHHIWYEKSVVNSIFTLSEVDSIISGRALSTSCTRRLVSLQGPRFPRNSALHSPRGFGRRQ